MSLNLSGKSILLTGGGGFLGGHIKEKLQEMSVKFVAPTSRECNLLIREEVEKVFLKYQPQIVIHSAVSYGGLEMQREKNVAFFSENLMMGFNLLEVGQKFNVEKFVSIGSAYSYPAELSLLKEEDFWKGLPSQVALGYGMAKKVVAFHGYLNNEADGLNSIHLVPPNLYGPRDEFDIKRSHVVASLIYKMSEAKKKELSRVQLWGDGSPVRQFLYVDDAVKGIFLAIEKYNNSLLPLNLAPLEHYTVKDLAFKIKTLVGFEGEIIWDEQKQENTPVRLLDNSKMMAELSWAPEIDLDNGLQKTIAWFLNTAKNFQT